MKKLIPAYILSFVISFTVFVYEPIMLYATNKTDLWFDFMTMMKPVVLLFVIAVIALIAFYTVLNKLSKKDKVYNIILTISFIVYFTSYIQGNYLLAKLPGLDGTTIIWKGFLVQNIITAVIWLILILSYIFTIKKYSFEKVLNVSYKVALAVFIMLLASALSTTFTTKKMFNRKYPILVTEKNFADFSDDKNFIIFLVDAVDSKKFNDELLKSKYSNNFIDFTYYPDTVSHYLFTRDSIPLILTGVPNYNEKDFYEYYNESFDKSPLMDELASRDYDVNLYENELIWTTKKGRMIKNTEKISNAIKTYHFAKCDLKYVAYKYLPYFLKKYAHIERMNFNYGKNTDFDNAYSWDNIDNYNMIKAAKVSKNARKQFKFIHTSGSHVPYNMDSELHRVKENKATYKDEINASIKLISSYIDLLKENGVYDNSVIILMADHGYNNAERIGRQNPIFYVKGFKEKNKEMKVSDKKVSHIDLMDAYKDLLDDKKAGELFKNIPQERERTIIYYEFTKENHMIEYKTKGHAWENDKLHKTGRVFNR